MKKITISLSFVLFFVSSTIYSLSCSQISELLNSSKKHIRYYLGTFDPPNINSVKTIIDIEKTKDKGKPVEIIFSFIPADSGEQMYLSFSERKEQLEKIVKEYNLSTRKKITAQYTLVPDKCNKKILAHKKSYIFRHDDDLKFRTSVLRGKSSIKSLSPNFHSGYLGEDEKINELQMNLFKASFHYFYTNRKKEAKMPLTIHSYQRATFYPRMSIKAWKDRFLLNLVSENEIYDSTIDRSEYLKDNYIWDESEIFFLQQLKFTPGKRVKKQYNLLSFDFSQMKILNKLFHMNIEKYVADRIPRALSSFINKEKGKVFLHSGESQDSLKYHYKQGFKNIWRLKTARGRRPNYFILKNPTTKKYRFIMTQLWDSDLAFHVGAIAAAKLKQKKLTYVVHKAVPIIQPLPEVASESFGADSILVMGVRSNLKKYLEKKTGLSFTTTQYSLEKTDAIFFSHPSHKTKYISVKNVYGDIINRILTFFYKKGVRKFVYIGTAGSLDSKVYKFGDIIEPQAYYDYSANKPVVSKPKRKTVQHGCVRSMLEETNALLKRMKKEGTASIDIEGCHLIKFLKKHKDFKAKILFAISDEVFGEETYDSFGEAEKAVLKKSINTMLPKLVPLSDK